MPTNTEETQKNEVKQSFEKGVFPPKIDVLFSIEKSGNEKLNSLKKEFKQAKKAFKISKANLEYLRSSGKSKKTLAKAKFAKSLAKSKKAELEAQIKLLEV